MTMTKSSTEMQEEAEKEKKMVVHDTIRLNWELTLLQTFFHIGAVMGIYLTFTTADPRTVIFSFIYGNMGGLGVTAGNHRLWSHRSYKAKLPLRVLLCIFSSAFHLKTIFAWVREHRIHHKYTETNTDPHNINRGLFFAHIGTQVMRHHPDFIAHINSVPMDDVLADPVVRFERKYHILLKTIFSYIVPVMIPMLLWNDNFHDAFIICVPMRICFAHHAAFLINGASHVFGFRPYSKRITATENGLLSLASLGEGWHNYHHNFPWDYAASEFGYINLTKQFIDVMAKLGLAYDLKTASPEMIASTQLKKQIVLSY